MPWRQKALRTIAAALLVCLTLGLILGGFTLGRSGRSLQRAAEERTRIAIRLEARQTVQAYFTTAGRLRLQLALVLDRGRGVPDEALDAALLGSNGPPDFSWQVLQEGRGVAEGYARTAMGGPFRAPNRQGWRLGEFKPPAAGACQLSMRVHRTQPGLDAANPAIEIAPTEPEARRALFQAGFRKSLGWILVAFGALLGPLGLFLLLRRRERLA